MPATPIWMVGAPLREHVSTSDAVQANRSGGEALLQLIPMASTGVPLETGRKVFTLIRVMLPSPVISQGAMAPNAHDRYAPE